MRNMYNKMYKGQFIDLNTQNLWNALYRMKCTGCKSLDKMYRIKIDQMKLMQLNSLNKILNFVAFLQCLPKMETHFWVSNPKSFLHSQSSIINTLDHNFLCPKFKNHESVIKDGKSILFEKAINSLCFYF